MASRRRRSPALAVVGLGVVAVVIVVLALPGSDSGADRQSYLDVVAPQLQLSAQQGVVVRDIRANAASVDRTILFQQVNDLAAGSAGVQREVSQVGPPGSLGPTASLLNRALRMRAQATATLRVGFQASLSGAPADQALAALAKAGQQFESADGFYGGFLRGLPPSEASSIAVPEYRWVLNSADWNRPALDLYLLSLRQSPSLAVRHDVAVALVSTQPSPASYIGSVAVLGLTRQLTVGVVVADTGNVAEHGVPVVAKLASGTTQSARMTVDLDPGQRRALNFGGFSLNAHALYVLTVTVGPVSADPTPGDDQQTLTIGVAG